jgi:hypothetical protein
MKKLLLYIVVLYNITIYGQNTQELVQPYLGEWENVNEHITTHWNKKYARGGRLFFINDKREIDEGTIYICKDSLFTYMQNNITKEFFYASYKLIDKNTLKKTIYYQFTQGIKEIQIYKTINN